MDNKNAIDTAYKKEKRRKIILMLLFVVSFLSFAMLTFILLKYSILPTKMRFTGIISLIVIYVLLQIIISTARITRIKFSIIAFILILLLVFQLLVFMYLNKGVSIFDRIGQKQGSESITYSLVVNKDSSYQTIDDVGSTEVSAALETDGRSIRTFLEKFKESNNKSISLKEGGQFIVMAKDLLDKKTEIILFNEGHRAVVEEQLPEFSENTRVLQEVNFETEKVNPQKASHVEYEAPFNVYISGIDTYGSLSTVARTDVNLVLSINPTTRKILITSIPRDTYMPIAGGGNNQGDKLTHSGIYGIEASIETLENFLDTDINYYARVNFNSLIRVVDILGGINVQNDRSFSAFNGDYFESGDIYLTGERALTFSRERKNLPGGDNDRGKNHIKVIEGIIKKALSPSILFNYNSLMDEMYNSMDTNMPTSKLIELINAQIENNKSWSFDNAVIEGYPSMSLPSYAMPGWELYMTDPSQESIDSVQSQIKSTLSISNQTE